MAMLLGRTGLLRPQTCFRLTTPVLVSTQRVEMKYGRVHAVKPPQLDFTRRMCQSIAIASQTRQYSKKSKEKFRCIECGWTTARWIGQCSSCGEWDTLEASSASPPIHNSTVDSVDLSDVAPLKTIFPSEVKMEASQYLKTGIEEFDNVLGGGLVPGSFVLIGGEPGIGKSTLVLDICQRVSDGDNVVYVSGEETVEQVARRAKRLESDGIGEVLIASERNLEVIEAHVRNSKACQLVVIDSIQTTVTARSSSTPGSASHIRDVAARLMELAKSTNTSIVVFGHVTKEGSIAGPRLLEHLVDVVLYFDSDNNGEFRILRNYKNRFGPTSEIALFSMTSKGLEGVADASNALIGGVSQVDQGSVIFPTVQGSRVFLLEGQTLATKQGPPRHQASGFDFQRVNLIAAVMQQIYPSLNWRDISLLVNLVGGMKVKEPAADLGICASMLSAITMKPLKPQSAFMGEVGLTGQVRSVPSLYARIRECIRSGVKEIFIPFANVEEETKALMALSGMETNDIKLVGIKSISELGTLAFTDPLPNKALQSRKPRGSAASST